jgi:hypothetical protein
MELWEITYGAIDPRMDRVASRGARFASALAALLRNPSSNAAVQAYESNRKAMNAAIAAAE